MEQLKIWLETDIHTSYLLLYVLACSFFIFLWPMLVGTMLPMSDERKKFLACHYKDTKCVAFMSNASLVSLVEEMIYRILPLSLTIYLVDPDGITVILVIVFLSSILFGLDHEIQGHRWKGVLKHSTGAFFLCLLYLKSGGMYGEILIPSCVVIVTHFLSHVCVIIMINIGSVKKNTKY